MKDLLLIILLLMNFSIHAQLDVENDSSYVSDDYMDEEVYDNTYNYDEDTYYDEEYEYYNPQTYTIAIDTASHTKNIDYSVKRDLPDDLADSYSGKDFQYEDNLKKEEKKKVETTSNSGAGLNLFLDFMAGIFPYLLGLLVVFIILKSFVNVDTSFWKRSAKGKIITDKLVHEDVDDIHENDYERLLQLAIRQNDFRAATRYYYLFLLKKLVDKGLLTYHKDKTNSEYAFELKNEQHRKDFFRLSYIYDYVWYGEFPIDKLKFNTIEKTYQKFIQNL